PVGHRADVLGSALGGPRQAAAERGGLGVERAAAGDGDRTGRARRDGVAAERVDDGAPGEPDQPDDDEGADPRVHPNAAAEGRDPAAGEGEEGATAGERAGAADAGGEWSTDADDPIDRGSRGDRGGSLAPAGAAQGIEERDDAPL